MSSKSSVNLTSICKICKVPLGDYLLKMPIFAPSLAISRVSKDPGAEKIEFELYECPSCGHLQQAHLPQLTALKPQFLWQRFREPEEHLDALAVQIQSLLLGQKPAQVFGVSWQDSSLLQRLEKLGNRALELSPHDHLGIPVEQKIFGIESIQSYFTERVAEDTFAKIGCADVVIARDILEHAFDPDSFLRALSILLNKDGLMVIEVPNSMELLKEKRYWLLWEHHISYFLKFTLGLSLESAGLKLLSLQSLQLDAGGYLVAIARKVSPPPKFVASKNLEAELWVKDFAASYHLEVQNLHQKLSRFIADKKKLYFYGANHVSYWWLQSFGVMDLFAGVIDDSPEKNGFYMPGTALQISGSEVLRSQRNVICLHLFGPGTAAKIQQKLGDFKENGGIFSSVENLYE